MKKLITLCVLALTMSFASAGEFITANYGSVQIKDFRDLVTDAFTVRFPVDSWALFIHSEAFIMPRDGLAICNAIVGVVPRGSNQFPMRTFKTTKTANVKAGKWNDDEALSFETECVRSALGNMMNTDPAKVYRAHPQ